MGEFQKQTWSIVVFCFNEVATVANIIEKTVKVLSNMPIGSFEVLVVNDGSNDGSDIEIDKAATKFECVNVVHHPTNLGIGKALRSGYFNAKYENICAIPADGQFDIEEIIPFASFPKTEFISFYRKENTSYSLFRNMLSKLNKMVNQNLNNFSMLDVNWVKIYKRELLLTLDLQIESSLIESEICAKLIKKGIILKEIESKYIKRVAGESKGASFKIVKQAMKDTLMLSYVLGKFKK